MLATKISVRSVTLVGAVVFILFVSNSAACVQHPSLAVLCRDGAIFFLPWLPTEALFSFVFFLQSFPLRHMKTGCRQSDLAAGRHRRY